MSEQKTPKQYGLLITKKSQKASPKLLKAHAAFGSDSDDDTGDTSKPVRTEVNLERLKKQSQIEIEKAVKDDPTVYEYDSIYDQIEKTKIEYNPKSQATKDSKPKYIAQLKKAAEERKKEHERQIERQVQKERDAEGEEFKDKEAFVTSAYKKKLEERAEEEERARKMEELEKMQDVTKQKDLSGFYRHLLKQTVGEENKTDHIEMPTTLKAENEQVDESKNGSGLVAEVSSEEQNDDFKTEVTEPNEMKMDLHPASSDDENSGKLTAENSLAVKFGTGKKKHPASARHYRKRHHSSSDEDGNHKRRNSRHEDDQDRRHRDRHRPYSDRHGERNYPRSRDDREHDKSRHRRRDSENEHHRRSKERDVHRRRNSGSDKLRNKHSKKDNDIHLRQGIETPATTQKDEKLLEKTDKKQKLSEVQINLDDDTEHEVRGLGNTVLGTNETVQQNSKTENVFDVSNKSELGKEADSASKLTVSHLPTATDQHEALTEKPGNLSDADSVSESSTEDGEITDKKEGRVLHKNNVTPMERKIDKVAENVSDTLKSGTRDPTDHSAGDYINENSESCITDPLAKYRRRNTDETIALARQRYLTRKHDKHILKEVFRQS